MVQNYHLDGYQREVYFVCLLSLCHNIFKEALCHLG